MTDINEIIEAVILLVTAINSSDFKNVHHLLIRLRYLFEKIKSDLEKLSSQLSDNPQYLAVALECYKFDQQLERLLGSASEDDTHHMSEVPGEPGSKCNSGSDDDEYQLSANAAAALQEFYLEQHLEEERLSQALVGEYEDFQPRENWQLSQFWYDDKTADVLAREALAAAGDHGCIACVSSPTVYKKIRSLKPASVEVKCLEYDQRFQMYGQDFVVYDFNNPLNLDISLKNHFDVVVVDPPFLSEDCLTKTAITVRFLAKDKVILCTGAVLEELALKLLQVSPCQFRPTHRNRLQNQFLCYANYDSESLNSEQFTQSDIL